MKLYKKISRSILFPTLLRLKVDNLIRNSTSNTMLSITYHGAVEKESLFFSPRNILKNQFEKHLIYIKKNYDVISVREMMNRIKENRKPKRKTLSISFDDGLKNNLYIVLPLLERYEIPATFFIPSICMEEMRTRCLWTEVIATLRYFYKGHKINMGNYIFEDFKEVNDNITIEDILKRCKAAERDKYIADLSTEYHLESKIQQIPEEIWKLMTKDEVISLSRSKFVEIGSHGHLHYNLGMVDIETAKQELIISKNLLGNALNKDIDLIAYPDGSYNEQVKNIAEQVGYRYQIAVDYLYPDDKNDTRIINRHSVSSGTTFESSMTFLNWAFHKKGH